MPTCSRPIWINIELIAGRHKAAAARRATPDANLNPTQQTAPNATAKAALPATAAMMGAALSVPNESAPVSRLFQTHGHMTFSYLTHVRIDRGKHLLHHYNLKLDEIAARCGYYGAPYFCHVFNQNDTCRLSSKSA
jgi:transcriptional regulator GlxA family with amidase domain